VKVTDNHFQGDFFQLYKKSSSFEITPELSFQDRELRFNELAFTVSWISDTANHFLSIVTPNAVGIPATERYDRMGSQNFPDETMDVIRVITPVHDITIGSTETVALAE
jgi:hypothetical protein